MERIAQSLGIRLSSPEHDGGCWHMRGDTPFPVDAFITALAADGIRAAHKPYPLDLVACIEELKAHAPGEDISWPALD
jgi:hypothetical protein